VVVISDPPPARGQPAKQHRMEDTCRCKTQMQICPSKRVNLRATWDEANRAAAQLVPTDPPRAYIALLKRMHETFESHNAGLAMRRMNGFRRE
jgi:hypothetical protein